jgi:transcriptional regulator of acetoin/glycerol metabolism
MLLPGDRPSHGEPASGASLGHLLDRERNLLAHARPLMDYLFDHARHSQSMVILADRHGTLLHALGDTDFLGKAARVALATGASWREQQRGTNAIGTALAETTALEIHGAEHFLDCNGFLTCAAAPIMSATGELLGILDVSGEQRGRHPHALTLVDMAARLIENRLVVATDRHPIRLHLHARREGIGSVTEGIVALAADGRIVGANRQGLALLRLTPAELGATPLSRVIEPSLDELLARHHRASISCAASSKIPSVGIWPVMTIPALNGLPPVSFPRGRVNPIRCRHWREIAASVGFRCLVDH